MKKTLSVLLAVLMLIATFAVCFAAFADETTQVCPYCEKPHSTEPNTCTCCFSCPYLDLSKVAACKRDANGGVKEGFCCGNCTGFYDCTCGCGCPFCSGDGDAEEQELQPLVPEQTQIHIKELFQTIMKKISEVFDRIFDVAFAVFNVH